MNAKAAMECLTVQVTPELKKALRRQAKRAGQSLSEWVRTRLELEGTDPDEMRAFVWELTKLGKRMERSKAEFEADRARSEARERDMPARLAAIRVEVAREFQGIGTGVGSLQDSASSP